MPKIKITKSESLPVCPYCSKEMETIEVAPVDWNKVIIYICPHCKKVLPLDGAF